MAQQIHRNAPEHGDVLRSIVNTHATLLFAERHLQAPVHAIFDRPVRTHRVRQASGVRRQAGKVVAVQLWWRHLFTRSVDNGRRTGIGPRRCLIECGPFERNTMPGLDPAMVPAISGNL
ncbi:hypothetical protein AWB78_08326 [Caballeronia calidae]|uniref:Uncharacterized protein n=1 Tax=Caballeronia calidae TaxID=1777139 RepID=A0A158EJA3_9BURK|nr:hypothetical protein AWB78_08326 [Caballeronia calidae]